MTDQQLNVLSIALDWIGSLLMLGTVWGWLYGKISPIITSRLASTQRRLLALERYIKIKYKTDITKVAVINRRLEYDRELGIYEWTGMVRSWSMRRAEKKYRQKLKDFGIPTREELKQWEQIDADLKESNALLTMYGWNKLTSTVKVLFTKVVNVITVSLFTGRLATIVFILGFMFWNSSKALSLYLFIYPSPLNSSQPVERPTHGP